LPKADGDLTVVGGDIDIDIDMATWGANLTVVGVANLTVVGDLTVVEATSTST
jgi:hypothetical protein